MPTILRKDGWRFFFYSLENGEPPHVHVRKGDAEAKLWLDRLTFALRLFSPGQAFCARYGQRASERTDWGVE